MVVVAQKIIPPTLICIYLQIHALTSASVTIYLILNHFEEFDIPPYEYFRFAHPALLHLTLELDPGQLVATIVQHPFQCLMSARTSPLVSPGRSFRK